MRWARARSRWACRCAGRFLQALNFFPRAAAQAAALGVWRKRARPQRPFPPSAGARQLPAPAIFFWSGKHSRTSIVHEDGDINIYFLLDSRFRHGRTCWRLGKAAGAIEVGEFAAGGRREEETNKSKGEEFACRSVVVVSSVWCSG